MDLDLRKDGTVNMELKPYSGRIYKFSIKMEETPYVLNVHNKDEFAPAHTLEHILNQVMGRLFGCERSTNAHIERKKSKINFTLDHKPSRQEEKAIVDKVNEVIDADLPVTFEFVQGDELPEGVKLDRLPEDASETIRLVRIGDFDVCPVVLAHPADDRWTSPELSEPFLTSMEKVPTRLVLLERAGHFPVEEPGREQLDDLLVTSLRQIVA